MGRRLPAAPRPRAKKNDLLGLESFNYFFRDFFEFLFDKILIHAVILTQIRAKRHHIRILVAGLH